MAAPNDNGVYKTRKEHHNQQQTKKVPTKLNKPQLQGLFKL